MARPEMIPPGKPDAGLPTVAAYKRVLQDVLERRPSGMRQRLAEALGKNRSFISQISNPTYPTPIPAQHRRADLRDLPLFAGRTRPLPRRLPSGASPAAADARSRGSGSADHADAARPRGRAEEPQIGGGAGRPRGAHRPAHPLSGVLHACGSGAGLAAGPEDQRLDDYFLRGRRFGAATRAGRRDAAAGRPSLVSVRPRPIFLASADRFAA